MKVKINRTQINRSKSKPIYNFTADVNYFCCDTLEKKAGGIVVITGEGVYPALHGRIIALERYNNCPWCGDPFEFVTSY